MKQVTRFAPSYLLAQGENTPAAVMHAISDLTHSSNVVRQVVDRFAKMLDEHMARAHARRKSLRIGRAKR